jgi:hypothetical protein
LVFAGSAAAAGIALAAFGMSTVWIVGANIVAIGAVIGAAVGLPSPQDDSALVAEVSHELRTPLTSILGTLELLTESTVALEPAEVDELIIAARGEADHLLHVVGNLHARSRLDRSILRPDSEPIDLRSITDKAVARLPRVARRCSTSPGDQVAVNGDPLLTMQVVTNIIQNIERYAPDGEVRVTYRSQGDVVAASFRDSGPGIPTYRAEQIFTDGASTQGLGLGLSLSRELARAMGGDLTLDNPGEPGAVFTLHLPACEQPLPEAPNMTGFSQDRATAHSPRARLLVDLAEALSETSLDRAVAGIRRILADLLGATGAVLLVSRKDGSFYSAGTHGSRFEIPDGAADDLAAVVSGGGSKRIPDISTLGWLEEGVVGGNAAMLLPVHDANRAVAVLAVGWKAADALPAGAAVTVSEALADMTASAIARTALTRDVVFERRLRSSVMNELPIAVSIFAGDPPEVIDWNRKERELLGIAEDGDRDSDLDGSQHQFDVRFADGTPLTIDNAPVTTAIRTGKATGPFILLLRRADGTTVHTRTYCAPFFDDEGAVAGAVVTSEPLDIAIGP